MIEVVQSNVKLFKVIQRYSKSLVIQLISNAKLFKVIQSYSKFVNTQSIRFCLLSHRPNGPRSFRGLRRRHRGSCATPFSAQVARRYGFQGSDKIHEGRRGTFIRGAWLGTTAPRVANAGYLGDAGDGVGSFWLCTRGWRIQ